MIERLFLADCLRKKRVYSSKVECLEYWPKLPFRSALGRKLVDQKLPQLFAVFCVTGFVGGCDGALRVRGNIPETHRCDLLLLDQGQEVIRRNGVSGEFLETFVVAPYRADYVVAVECDGIVLREEPVAYGRTVDYQNPIDLGSIDLSRDSRR